jgi:hypothetical protein
MRSRNADADPAILVFLTIVVLVITLFAVGMYRATRPTVLTNVQWVGPNDTRLPFDFSAGYSNEEQELLAVETAELENKEQGLTMPRVAESPVPTNVPDVRTAEARPKPKPAVKPKRVVRVPPRAPDSWHAGWDAGRSTARNPQSWFW